MSRGAWIVTAYPPAAITDDIIVVWVLPTATETLIGGVLRTG